MDRIQLKRLLNAVNASPSDSHARKELAEFIDDHQIGETFSVEEASAYLHIAPQSLYVYNSLGTGPVFHKAGRTVLYYAVDLDVYQYWRTRGGLSPQELRTAA